MIILAVFFVVAVVPAYTDTEGFAPPSKDSPSLQAPVVPFNPLNKEQSPPLPPSTAASNQLPAEADEGPLGPPSSLSSTEAEEKDTASPKSPEGKAAEKPEEKKSNQENQEEKKGKPINVLQGEGVIAGDDPKQEGEVIQTFWCHTCVGLIIVFKDKDGKTVAVVAHFDAITDVRQSIGIIVYHLKHKLGLDLSKAEVTIIGNTNSELGQQVIDAVNDHIKPRKPPTIKPGVSGGSVSLETGKLGPVLTKPDGSVETGLTDEELKAAGMRLENRIRAQDGRGKLPLTIIGGEEKGEEKKP